MKLKRITAAIVSAVVLGSLTVGAAASSGENLGSLIAASILTPGNGRQTPGNATPRTPGNATPAPETEKKTPATPAVTPTPATTNTVTNTTDSTTATTNTTAQTPATAQEAVTVTKTPKAMKAKAKKNKVTVSWKKLKTTKKNKKFLKQVKFIQVQYSTDPNFAQNVKVKKVGKQKSSVTLKGLQRKTLYYVHMRYVGKTGVSNWTKTKTVKTK